MPFLLVAGLYSMNVILPGGVNRGSPVTFIVLLVIILILIGALLAIFRRRRII